MKTSYPYYKITISYFNLKDENHPHTEKTIVFKEERPIESRKEAIEHFRSLEDIFEQAKKNGHVLSSITEIFNKTVDADTLPSLNLYICENDNEEDDLVLFGTLLESTEERLIELTDECQLYHENNLDHEGIDLIRDETGTVYTVLKGSLFKEEDLEKMNHQ